MLFKIDRKFAGANWANTDTILFYNPDTDLWVWQDYVDTVYYMSLELGRKINFNPDSRPFVFTPYMYTYNYHIWYLGSATYYGKLYLWYGSTTSKWLITRAIGGRNAEYQDNAGQWQGDEWWESSGSNRTGTFVPRGINKTGRSSAVASYAVVNGWTRWYSPYGEYWAVGTGRGTKRVGWGYLTAGAEPTFYEDKRTDYKIFENANKTRYLWKYGGKWTISPILFTVDLSVGYWQTSGSINGTYTRYFSPSGSPPSVAPEPATYVLAAMQYSENYKTTGTVTTQEQYISQVALWL